MDYKTIQEILQRMGRYANKNLGQNFLVNQIYASMIVEYLNPENGDNVLEIGAGLGGLTDILVQTNANITINECDHDFIKYLRETYPSTPLIDGDILLQDVSHFNKIVGNLPYYITTPIIKKVLLESLALRTFVFMVQKEVGLKLLAKENSKDYGPLHILISLLGAIKYEKEIKPHNFYPHPHVDSVVMSLNVENETTVEFKSFLFKNLTPLFAYNRKTLRNNLKGHKYGRELSDIFESNCISLDSRPQQIAASDYIKILKSLFVEVTK